MDERFSWCDECWHCLFNKQMPPGLVKHVPAGTYVGYVPHPPPVLAYELSSLGQIEHKSVATIAAGPLADSGPGSASGSFSGYLASFTRDHEGDTIMGPAAVADSVKAVNDGAIAWTLTDSHSDLASDVVAAVTSAVVDSRGVRIQGLWMPTERAQALRQMVKGGAKLGLSIDYLTRSSRPDGQGGRYLDRIVIVGGALTTHPMNPMCTITESKHAATVPVVNVYDDAQSRHRDPGRDRDRAEDELLASVSWPPPGLFDRKTALALLQGAALARSRRELAGDPVAAREQAIRDQANRYSSDLHAWLAAHRDVPLRAKDFDDPVTGLRVLRTAARCRP